MFLLAEKKVVVSLISDNFLSFQPTFCLLRKKKIFGLLSYVSFPYSVLLRGSLHKFWDMTNTDFRKYFYGLHFFKIISLTLNTPLRPQKPIPEALASICWHYSSLASFWASVSECGIQRAQIFRIFRWSCRILGVKTLGELTPRAASISLYVEWGFSLSMVSVRRTKSSVIAVTGLPVRSSSLRFVLPLLNSANHRKTVALEGARSPKGFWCRTRHADSVRPLLKSYRIIARKYSRPASMVVEDKLISKQSL